MSNDIEDMKTAGDVIACVIHDQNKHDIVLYPRGRPFLTRLSGTVTARMGAESVETSADLREEIRRGDAILVADRWYRVSSQVKTSSASQQPIRAQAPGSVSSTTEMSERNEYSLKFTATSLPLSKPISYIPPELIGPHGFAEVPVFKHGCTNDIRSRWNNTFSEMRSKNLLRDDKRLQEELLRLRLVSVAGVLTSNATKKRPVETDEANSQRKPRKQHNRFYRSTNTHLRGGIIGDVIFNSAEAPSSSDHK
jgi:hypothetical protein